MSKIPHSVGEDTDGWAALPDGLPDDLNAPGRILIVDDEEIEGENCAFALREVGHHLTRVTQFPLEAPKIAREWRPDIIILDIEMPNMDGLTLGRLLKKEECGADLVFLTRKDEAVYWKQGFKITPHYITKPYNAERMVENVNSVLRVRRERARSSGQTLSVSDSHVIVDSVARSLTIPPRQPVSLSPKLWELLNILIDANGKLVSKEYLLKQIWPDSYSGVSIVEVNIRRLRRRIEPNPSQPEFIIADAREGRHGYYFNTAYGRDRGAL